MTYMGCRPATKSQDHVEEVSALHSHLAQDPQFLVTGTFIYQFYALCITKVQSLLEWLTNISMRCFLFVNLVIK